MFGVKITTRRPFPAPLRHLQCARLYSTPQYKKTGNFLVNALNYVKEVDDYQDKIAHQTPELAMAEQLVGRIADKPELLAIFLLFHHELAKYDVTPSLNRQFSGAASVKFRLACLWKLNRIHSVFWEQCRLADVAERAHKLKFLPQDIGVLDPKYYGPHYEELQSGVFRGTDFRHVEILGRRQF